LEKIRTRNFIHFSFFHQTFFSFSKIETARLIDKGGTYQILTTFKKPLGEQTSYEEPPVPIRKSHSKNRSKKRIRPPPSDIEEEKPIRRAPVVPMHEEEEEEQEKRSPRIYTEDIEVRVNDELLFVMILFK
jgi:hypothetical protein